MPGDISPWWLVLASYLVGASPFGFLAGKLAGVDVRQHGSGNIGATNVIRTLGKRVGIPVFALDVLKGFLPTWLACRAVGEDPASGLHYLPAAVALAAVLGHSFTFWLRFRGGKGVATSAGALLALMPVPLACAAAVWLALFVGTRYVAVASIGAAWAIPAAVAVSGAVSPPLDRPALAFGGLLAVLVTLRHRSNLARLRAGTENRFGSARQDVRHAGAGDGAAGGGEGGTGGGG